MNNRVNIDVGYFWGNSQEKKDNMRIYNILFKENGVNMFVWATT